MNASIRHLSVPLYLAPPAPSVETCIFKAGYKTPSSLILIPLHSHTHPLTRHLSQGTKCHLPADQRLWEWAAWAEWQLHSDPAHTLPVCSSPPQGLLCFPTAKQSPSCIPSSPSPCRHSTGLKWQPLAHGACFQCFIVLRQGTDSRPDAPFPFPGTLIRQWKQFSSSLLKKQT